MNEDFISDLSGLKDEKSFKLLYDRHVEVLRFFAARYIHDGMAIEDIVQDAFVRIWENRERFTEMNAMKAYLYQVVRNGCIDYLRRNKVTEKYVTQMLSTPATEEFFLNNMMEAEVFAQVLQVFNQLTPAVKEVYLLSLDGKSHREIAEQLNITVNTVKKHKNSANHFMRERLKNVLTLLLGMV